MSLFTSGGFGLFGKVTEGGYRLPKGQRIKLEASVMLYVLSEEFLNIEELKQPEIRKKFFALLKQTEFVGSHAGGAAGLLQTSDDETYKLRFALQMENGAGNFWGLIPQKIAMKHELLHFVREAQSLTKRNVSLFEAERKSGLAGKIALMLREEAIVWWKTLT